MRELRYALSSDRTLWLGDDSTCCVVGSLDDLNDLREDAGEGQEVSPRLNLRGGTYRLRRVDDDRLSGAAVVLYPVGGFQEGKPAAVVLHRERYTPDAPEFIEFVRAGPSLIEWLLGCVRMGVSLLVVE